MLGTGIQRMTGTLQRGVTLIEMMIALAIVAMVLMVGVPAFTIFLQNQQIKNAAQTVMIGLSSARAESIRRNAAVRFQFVSDLTAGCVLATNSLAWVVSLADPDSACDAVPGATTQSTGLPDNNKMGGVWIMNAGTTTAHLMTPGE